MKKIISVSILFVMVIIMTGCQLLGSTPPKTETPIKSEIKLEPITLESSESIATCGTTERQTPAQNIQNQLGISSLLENGYEMIDICREENSRISFLLAKNEPNLLFTSNPAGDCTLACDRVAFGTLNPQSKETIIILSEHRLGIHAEAYDQSCFIDAIEPKDGLFGDNLYFYCGSGESGGFVNWYRYNFGNDKLVEVQRLKGWDPETYDVKEPDMLKKFRFKSNSDYPVYF